MLSGLIVIDGIFDRVAMAPPLFPSRRWSCSISILSHDIIDLSFSFSCVAESSCDLRTSRPNWPVIVELDGASERFSDCALVMLRAFILDVTDDMEFCLFGTTGS